MTNAVRPSFWSVVTAAPHRPAFLLGAVQAVIVMVWWTYALIERYAGVGSLMSGLAVPAMHAHVFLMLYGLFPFFIFGFTFTVYPRWMAAPLVPRSRYLATGSLLGLGMLLFYLGLFIARWLLIAGVVLYLLGWLVGLAALWTVFRAAHPRSRPHETVLNLALLAGAIGVGVFAYAIAFNDGFAYALAETLGLWLFLAPVVFTVSHRMIPFFSESALRDYRGVRPGWTLPVVVAGLALRGLLGLALEDARWLVFIDAPLALIALYHLAVWQSWRTLHVGLLAVLHIAFVWFAIAFMLYVAQDISIWREGYPSLGRAPLHALGIGFVASMLMAMASRVTLGHSGQPLAADRLTLIAFALLNVAALLRIGGDLEWAEGDLGYTLIVLAGGAWLAAFIPWAWHYAPRYVRVRADGKPG